jgi:arginyl-tRNA synthetase
MTGARQQRVAPNPVVEALQAAVASAPMPPGVDGASLVVEPNLSGVPAELRVAVPAADGRPDRAACEAVAAALASVPGVARTAVSPPNVYVSPTTELLARLVPDAALSDPDGYGRSAATEPQFHIVSFSGPNVNKPLHLGHLRSNFLGMAVSTLLADQGHTVERQAPHCDWGIHIAQALVAWRRWGDGRTPEEAGVKGDHFVGQHYVMFHDRITPTLEAEATNVMQALEDGDAELWEENRRFTRWADAGIRETYARIGTRMDALFYDSDYLDEGKRLIADGLRDGRCKQRDDSSIYIDLTDHDLGEVTLVRRDGTPTVYRQWMAVNIARYPSRPFDQVHVVTGQEWVAGIRILRETLRALGQEWAARMEGVHYGLVVLPKGRMKSRQGTGVGADAQLDEARDRLLARWAEADGGVDDDKARAEVCEALGLALSKYGLLAAKRSRQVVFSEQTLWEDVLPRLAAVVRALRWAEGDGTIGDGDGDGALDDGERHLLLTVNRFPNVVDRATSELEPAHLVRYLDDVAAAVRALAAEPTSDTRRATAVVIRRACALLNVELPSSLETLPPPFGGGRRQDHPAKEAQCS